LLFAAAWLLIANEVGLRADILLSNSFNYADGPLVTVSGGDWVHHSGATTGEVKVVSARVLLSQTNAEDVSVLLSGAPYPSSTNVLLYASFTLNVVSLPAGGGTYFGHFKSASTAFGSRVCLTTNGAAPGAYRIGLANSSTSPVAVVAQDLVLNMDNTIVVRYGPSNGVCNLWLSPVAESDPSITATDAIFSVSAFALRESLSGGDGMGTLFIDDLLVGTSFAEVMSAATPRAPQIITQPADQTVTVGSNASFSVVAQGSVPLSYQWSFSGTNLMGQSGSTLVLTNAGFDQAGPYSVFVSNSVGSTNSESAMLTVIASVVAPSISMQPQSQIVTEGNPFAFSVTADGDSPLSYQWKFNGANLAGATDSTIAFAAATTNQSGSYFVVITNGGGAVTSDVAVLTVNRLNSSTPPGLALLMYNVKGNGSTNWSTNAPQVQAIGRELMFLQPDIITFNEIPYTNAWQMTNWITAFLPGYNLATNSGTDGFIRSVIASRFPITRSQKWLDGVSLAQFGYSGNFTRDLFEAQIAVPGFPQPLHVFVTHLKATTSSPQADADKRAAEASAISNVFVTAYLTTNALHPYILSGDMNEDVFRPETNRYTTGQPIQRLVSAPTGLMLTTPVNPFTDSDLTESIQGALDVRFDYILPCGLLFSNIIASQVFRTDRLPNPPAPLLANDDKTASDHLPVVMTFANPYAKPFRITSITRTNQSVSVEWESVPGQPYRVEGSSDLATWSVVSTNITATGANASFRTNLADLVKFVRVYRFP
jgi:endonuclease/exonuclease/phosphatase family metal-dependent hydrolase